jgi:hypothetical protein
MKRASTWLAGNAPGVTPPVRTLARAPFKATAGLHHPLRGLQVWDCLELELNRVGDGGPPLTGAAAGVEIVDGRECSLQIGAPEDAELPYVTDGGAAERGQCGLEFVEAAHGEDEVAKHPGVRTGAVCGILVDRGGHVEGGRGKEAGVVDQGAEQGTERG